MSLTWPWALIALLAVPLLFAVRWWMLRRRKRVAVRVSSIALIRAALPGRTSWRRRIPVILFVAGLIMLGFAMARPQASVLVPRNASAILLAIDVSRSMCSTDVAPNRLAAAREAAKQFVTAQDDQTRIGLVAFAGIAGLLVEPTTDKKALLAAIDTLETSRGTAIGQAILASIDAIAEINPDVAATGVDLEPDGTGTEGTGGDYQPDTIVVLTDGRNTQGVSPVTAAEQAVARHLRVYTIGFGTTTPSPMVCGANQLGGGDFRGDPGGRFGGGPGNVLDIDEETLAKVAKITGGEYFRAQDAKQLIDVMTDLPKTIVAQKANVELTAWFVLPGTLLILGAIALSVWWNRSLSLPRAG
jgi:Ca-activated chloride channel family protein